MCRCGSLAAGDRNTEFDEILLEFYEGLPESFGLGGFTHHECSRSDYNMFRFRHLIALSLLLGLFVPQLAPAETQPPAPATQNASSPPEAKKRDPNGKWYAVVPVMLWWSGPAKPRYKVCTEADLGEGEFKKCEGISGAPDHVKGIQMYCEWDCSKLAPRKLVEVYGKVENGVLVATESREPPKKDSKTEPKNDNR